MTEAGESERRQGEYSISTDNERLNLALIHDFISNQSYFDKANADD